MIASIIVIIVAIGIGCFGFIFRAIGMAMKMARHAVIIRVNMISIMDMGLLYLKSF